MNNETPTETAEPKNDLLTNYFLGVINIGLFFTLSCLLDQSIGGLYFGALWLVVYTGYVFGSAILFVVEDNFPSVKSIRTYYLNRYIILLFETGLILLAILLVPCLINVISHIHDDINWGSLLGSAIILFPALYVLSSLISIVAVVFSMLLFGMRHYCDLDYNPIVHPEPSKQTNSSPIRRNRNAFQQIVIEIWRQFAIFTLWITFPLLLIVGLFIEDLLSIGELDFSAVLIVPLVVGSVIIQFAYIVFNVVMRRLYARIGNRITARER